VSNQTVQEQLRRARVGRGESLASVAARCGSRVENLQAIEYGRFQDLPTGLYARVAVRRYAGAVGLNPDEILALCAPLLPEVEDPITALGRLRGGSAHRRRQRQNAATKPVSSIQDVAGGERHAGPPPEWPSWRMLAASVIDAAAVLAMLLAVVTCTVAMGVPMSALGRAAAPAFALMAFVLGGCYFVVLGGIVGATPGEQAVGLRSETVDQVPLDLRAVAARTLQCISRDASFIELTGKWIGRTITGHRWHTSVDGRHRVEHRAA
jgi:uncharacterized RDD family membrane protein YckC